MSLSRPLISVVVAAYNAEGTLTQALESIARQTYPEIEVIVVDDASTDGTAAVAAAYSLPGGRPVRVKTQVQNGGPAAARNTGLDLAAGDWIAFLDADDEWMPSRLAAQLACLEIHPEAALICTRTVPFEGAAPPPRAATTMSVGPEACRVLTLEEFTWANPVMTSTVLARKAALLEVGGFDTAFRGPEDYDLWLRVAAAGTVVKVEQEHCWYRYVPGSLSMDDRTFLPQVLAVLRRAFAVGGALHGLPELRGRALAEQYFSASWMAYSRHARGTAIGYILRSWFACAGRIGKEQNARLFRLQLLLRYLTRRYNAQS